MADTDNNLAVLNEAEARAKAGEPSDADKAAATAASMDLDPFAPTDKPAADTISTRSPEAEAPGQFEEVKAPAPALGSDAYDDIAGSTPHVLNATPGADPLAAPDVHSQRTGPATDTYRAPAMTRGSAINQLEVRWGELVAMLHDFDHDMAGLPDDLVALVDFVKSRRTD